MDKGVKFFLIVFGFLTFLAVCYELDLIFIRLARVLFWSSIVISVLAFLFLVYFSYVFFKGKEDYFLDDLSESWILALCCLGIIIVLYFLAGGFYNGSYSPEAIKAEKEAMAYLQDYNVIMNLPYQIVEEQINNSCKDPSYPCEKVKQTYQMVRTFIWWEDKADSISKIIVTAKKIK